MGRRTFGPQTGAWPDDGWRGGPSTVRQFLQADLIDFMHLVVVPITLGRGRSSWEGIEGVEDRFAVESVTSTSGLVHQLWNRVRAGS